MHSDRKCAVAQKTLDDFDQEGWKVGLDHFDDECVVPDRVKGGFNVQGEERSDFSVVHGLCYVVDRFVELHCSTSSFTEPVLERWNYVRGIKVAFDSVEDDALQDF